MQKKKIKLQQRIFISFFLIVLSLFCILFLSTWYIFNIGIKQTEKIEISKSITNAQISINDYKINTISELNEISNNIDFIKAVQSSSKNMINDALIEYPKYKNLIIYDKDNNIIHGFTWNLIINYYHKIVQYSINSSPSTFTAKQGNKIYFISFHPINDKNEEYLGLAIFAQLGTDQINYTNNNNLPVTIIPLNCHKNSEDNERISNIELMHQIDMMKSLNKSSIIYLQNSKIAYGLILLKDIIDLPQAVIAISYHRTANNFFGSGFLFFSLILLALALIIISMMGLWFSKSIMQPVKEISDKMAEISRNPSNIKPFTERFSGVLGDITDVYNSMSSSLNSSRETLLKYKSITDNINVGIFFMDKDQNIIVCNPALKKIFAVDNNTTLNLSKLTNIDSKKLFEIGHSYSHNYYFEIIQANTKRYLILDLNITKGDQVNYFGSITDETSMIKSRKTKQALELELIKSNRLAKIGKLLVGIVHNMNSPLNSIVGYSQFLKRDFPDNKDIDRLYLSSKKIATMVKGLLNKNRNENRSMPQNVNINEVINDELELCDHNLFYKHYVQINKDLSDTIKYTNAVYSDISLCIANILNNAFDAMQNSSLKTLDIKTYMTDNYITVEISDTGCGIAKDKIEKIFDLNYTSKIDSNTGGYGLGLTLTKTIIEKCKGKIEVTSKIKQGTMFKLFFPQM